MDSDKKDSYECSSSIDLMATYGRSIPPYIENFKDQSLKTLNINNLKAVLDEKGYKYLTVSIPILVETNSKYQLIIKLDWYNQSERFQTLNGSPLASHQIILSKNDTTTLRRYYLQSFRSVWQAFDLIQKNQDEFSSAGNLKPLSRSNIIVQFNEPVSFDQLQHRTEHVRKLNFIFS